MKRTALLFILFSSKCIACCAQQQGHTGSITTPGSAKNQAIVKVAIARLTGDIPTLLKESDVPGLSIALVRNGKLVWSKAFGIANSATKKPVTNETVFEAASLSKPVFAYAVLKLVDEGKLNLDTPLNKYLGNNYDVVNDDRINFITARHVLSHTSGFPNWRDNDGTKTLLIHFTPGEKFSYSGEGIVYLSKVVEKITGMNFEDFMQQYALKPLGMAASSYIWQDRFDSLKAYRHDIFGKLSGRNQPPDGHATGQEKGNAAASLCTTASDYAKFVIALMNGTGLKRATWEQMFTPQIKVNAKYPEVAWGLGIGLETMGNGKYAWHWGDNGDSKAYVTAFLPGKNAVMYFADGSNGLSFTKEILDDAIGGNHPALAQIDYERYNSSSRKLLKSVISEGALPSLKDYKENRKRDSGLAISESKMNGLGYALLQMKKFDDAIEVFKQNTDDFPQSWNAWDSLAEGYMDKGDREMAIKYYEKSLAMNPANTNGAAQIKKLKQGP